MEEAIKSHVFDHYGLTLASAKRIQAGVMNANFFCEIESGEKYIFKIYNHKSSDEIEFEMEILAELEKNDFISPRVRKWGGNDLWALFDKKPSVLYSFIDGDQVKNVDETLIRNIGGVIGRLHCDLADFVPMAKKSSWDPADIARLVEEHGEEISNRNVPHADAILNFVRTELPKFSFPNLPRGVTHQDIKLENVIVQDGKIVGLIDFDNSYYGELLHDLTTTAIWTCFPGGNLDKKLLTTLIEGYEQKRVISKTEKEIFYDCLRWRLVREVFIGPFVTLDSPEITSERSLYFMSLYGKIS